MQIIQKELKVKNYTLRGLFSKPDGDFKTIVVMFHGFTGHMNENGYLFKQLTETLVGQGFATLRYDFMGSGISDGHFSDMTFFTEYEDGIEIVNEAYRLNNNTPVVLLGFSLGGAVASRVSLATKDKLEKLILLSPAGHIINTFSNPFRLKPMDENGNVDMGGYYMNVKIRDTMVGYEMYKDIETFDRPVLIMQGSADQAVHPSHSKEYDDLYPNSKYVLVEGAEHCYTKVCYRDEVRKTVLAFVQE